MATSHVRHTIQLVWEGMDLELYLTKHLDLYFVNDFNLLSKFCLMYSLLLFYTVLDDLKVMF